MALAVTLFSNLAAAFLKLEDPHQALCYAEKALRFDEGHASKLQPETGARSSLARRQHMCHHPQCTVVKRQHESLLR